MPVDIRGVAYETVKERLEAAHHTGIRPVGIKRIETTPMEVAGRLVVCATVYFDDERQFTGMSEAKLDATSGADRDAPVECAETSAVGRALANAGYFGSEGLASKEEIRSAQARGARWNRPQPGTTTARPLPPGDGPVLARGLHAPPDDGAPPPPAYEQEGRTFDRAAARFDGNAPGLASDKQRELLKKFGFEEEAGDPNTTKTLASDLISQAIEAQRARR